MATQEERLASFQPVKQKSSKRTPISTFRAKGWPHPSSFKATPSSLSAAGFSFDPLADKGDNVTCFSCDHSLGEWTEEDDPYVEHLKVYSKCKWALARCTIEIDRQDDGSFVFTDAARLPNSKAMEKARADTFKGQWIHDVVKAHTANSRKMAKAGWIYNPANADESDIATCFYCGKGLDGWEMGDDPTHEHRSRVPNCPVFTATLAAEQVSPPLEVPRPPVSTTSTAARSKTGTRRGKVESASQQATTSDHPDTAAESDAPPPVKGRRTTKSVAPSSLQPESVPSVSQASITSSSKPATAKTSKGKSSRSTSVSRTVEEIPLEVTQQVQDVAPDLISKAKSRKPGKKTQRATSKTLADDSAMESYNAATDAYEEEEPPKVAPKQKASKKKGKNGKTPSVASMDLEEERTEVQGSALVVDADVTPIPPSRKTMDSLGGWDSFQAANQELEELARELHIEEELAAIGKKPSPPRREKLPPVKATSKSQAARPPAPLQPDPWSWREREKSVGAKSHATETEMTEEEEVEMSLAGDDPDEEQDDEADDKRPSPPHSRPPSTAPSAAPSTSVSTTVSSKTKVKIKEMKAAAASSSRINVLRDEEMVDMPTPKANAKGSSGNRSGASSRPVANSSALDMDSGSNPFLVAPKEKQGLDVLTAQLEPPALGKDFDSRRLTEEEREMTLEEYLQYDVDRRKAAIRKMGRKWIEEFLESSEQARERLRAM